MKKENPQSQEGGDKNEQNKEKKVSIDKPWKNWGARTRWSHGQNQPSPELKKAGWAKRKRNQELARMILGAEFIGKVVKMDAAGKAMQDEKGNFILEDSPFKQKLKTYFGLNEKEVNELSNEEALFLRQVGQAIEQGDMTAAQLLLDRAYGQPAKHVEFDNEGNTPIINITVVAALPAPDGAEKLEGQMPEIHSEEQQALQLPNSEII